ncbi:MAG: hypothetical protein GXY94_04975 [Bacteroidales bacterium]|nr:hypothetical protein [Bacteroidales bacterium]
MKNFLKYLGIVLIFVGVLLLAIYTFQSHTENTLLLSSMLLVIIGILVHIITNKYID